MDGGERTGMAGVEGVEQRARLDSAYLAKDDAVRSPAERGFQQVVESDRIPIRVGLAFDGHDVRLFDAQLRGIFDDDDALVVGN